MEKLVHSNHPRTYSIGHSNLHPTQWPGPQVYDRLQCGRVLNCQAGYQFPTPPQHAGWRVFRRQLEKH